MTFSTWLRKQATRDDPVGDLATDYIEDGHRDRPKRATPEQLYWHMVSKNACSGAMEALEKAVAEWKP